MAGDAAAIVTGHVTRIDSYWDPLQGQIFTNVTLSLEEVLKGDLSVSNLTIQQVGGTVGDLRSWIFGSPEFVIGEKVLLFLTQNEDGSLRVAHLYQGKYSILVDYLTREEFAYQGTPDGVHAFTPGAPDSISPLRERLHRLNDFKARIRSAMKAESPQRKRRRILPSPQVASVVSQSNAEFTLLGNARWFQPDSGLPVVMFTNQQGEPLAPTLGFSQVQQALAAWSNVSGANFNYQDGGKTTAVGLRSDGVNAISFRDPLKQMTNPVGCSGTLAQAGYFSTTSQSRVVNGQLFYKIVEADVVVNDGWENCGIFYQDPENLAEVLAHELGHALGLGHSPDSNALMYAYAHFDGRSASLTDDDRAGLMFIYPGAAAETPSFSLTASLSASPTSVRRTWTITVKMPVTNGGSQSVTVTPSSLALQGTGSASLSSSPSSATIDPGQSKTFTWQYRANKKGTIRFTGSATSPQGNSDPATSNSVTIF